MSKQIDWSKAPEDADKYNTHNSMFYKGERPYLQVFIHEQWMPSAIMKSNELFVYRPTTPSWSGEGLPPVGVVCEFKSPSSGGWLKARIIFVSAWTVVLYVFFEHDEHCYSVSAFEKGNLQFRPIRTPEQIAADEREAAIKEMLEDAGRPDTAKTRDQAQLLYDAGWRKVERAQ